jgi:hypothetical protein
MRRRRSLGFGTPVIGPLIYNPMDRAFPQDAIHALKATVPPVRRALVAIAAFVVVAGAFTAGALIFRDNGSDDVAKATIRCFDDGDEDSNGDPVGWNEGCDRQSRDEVADVCDEGIDSVQLTIIYTYETRNGREVEDSRRTLSKGC